MNNFPRKDDPSCLSFLETSKHSLKDLEHKLKINQISNNFFGEIVIPLTTYFNNLPKREKPYLICLTGGQGSGKTTLSEFIQLVLKESCNKSTVGFSIDDIYKTKEERKELSETVHPLCKVRGVPGTHNIKMGLDTLRSLYYASPETLTLIPSFCKPLDEHYPREKWKKYFGKPNFIFFDAWCGGAKSISEEDWKPPMNDLEREEDPDGIWSKWSNQQLAGEYQELFSLFDFLVLIKVPNISFVYQSRWIQEQTLRRTLSSKKLKKRIMTKREVYRFVMHYERLTHYILEEMPSFADIVLERDEQFNFLFSKVP